MKRIAILQSNYIPWKGYFDIIRSVDEFVIYDEAQYTVRDWRNRNIIKSGNGLKWLTIPVETKGKRNQKIIETKVVDNKWSLKHWETIRHTYKTAPCFRDFENLFKATYKECLKLSYLSEINRLFIDTIVKILGINTLITNSSEYNLKGDRNEKIISICLETGSKIYVTGPAAKGYIDDKLFREAGISILWTDYSGYPEYNQMYPPFKHNVSIIDLILNEGDKAKAFMNNFR